jgi:para-nitrobenzyl esterase
VWIYGGGVDNGSGAIPLYAGDVLARKGVIVVTFNYRLGVFGFLAHPELTRESPHHSSGDYGLQDQIAALQWVQHNIAAFGGDPARVTVFGQSSGSISISALTASPLTEGLFKRAIGESGGLFEPMKLLPELALSGAEQQGQRFAGRAAAPSLDALRAIPAEKLEKVPFGPAIILDGYTLPTAPYDVYRAGKQHKVDLLIGSNADEGRLFPMGQPVTAANYTQRLEEDFPAPLVWLAAPAAPKGDAQALTAWTRFETDMRFRWDMWTWARMASDPGVFLYEFDRTPPFASGSRYAGLGATHGMEMPYVFGHLDPAVAAWTAEDRRLSDALVSYWTNFAKAGDPNGAGLPPWPRYTTADPRFMRLDAEIAAGPVPDLGSLHKIDHIYTVARFTVRHTALVIAGLLAVLVLLVLGLWLAFHSWRRRRRAMFSRR